MYIGESIDVKEHAGTLTLLTNTLYWYSPSFDTAKAQCITYLYLPVFTPLER